MYGASHHKPVIIATLIRLYLIYLYLECWHNQFSARYIIVSLFCVCLGMTTLHASHMKCQWMFCHHIPTPYSYAINKTTTLACTLYLERVHSTKPNDNKIKLESVVFLLVHVHLLRVFSLFLLLLFSYSLFCWHTLECRQISFTSRLFSFDFFFGRFVFRIQTLNIYI